MRSALKFAAVGAVLACAAPLYAQQAAKPAAAAPVAKAAPAAAPAGVLSGQTVRIAFIDPLSGGMANVGQNQLRTWQFLASKLGGANNAAGVKFEIVGFDNKLSPQESLNNLKSAIDQGIRYVAQGNGS